MGSWKKHASRRVNARDTSYDDSYETIYVSIGKEYVSVLSLITINVSSKGNYRTYSERAIYQV